MNDSSDAGLVVLFGSGETSPAGQKIFDQTLQQLPKNPRVALLETPAGFELNSPQVVGRIADFLQHRLQNYHPQTEIIPARKRGTAFSPDSDQIVAPLLQADLIFAGPGSPTYAVRQLRDSLAWHYLQARHRLGAALVFASAAVIAIGAQVLPVYEIYKAGEEPHWKPGLNFFAPFGLSLTFIPHWNNNDGGAELDTSRCFIGQSRFENLMAMLPPGQTVVGIDEHTALLINCAKQTCEVQGLGTVTRLRDGMENVFASGTSFPLKEFGDCQCPGPGEALPDGIWQKAQEAAAKTGLEAGSEPPKAVQNLVEERQAARTAQNWAMADELRDRIADLGWRVQDTPDGPQVSKS